jgi:hypothetical protein
VIGLHDRHFADERIAEELDLLIDDVVADVLLFTAVIPVSLMLSLQAVIPIMTPRASAKYFVFDIV